MRGHRVAVPGLGQFLSEKRTAQAIGELFGIPVSDGTVAAVTARAAGDLTEFLTQVTARISAAPVVNFDETWLPCEGRNAWLHTAFTPKMGPAVLAPTPLRGSDERHRLLRASPAPRCTTPVKFTIHRRSEWWRSATLTAGPCVSLP